MRFIDALNLCDANGSGNGAAAKKL
jgi:hypothetical protein